MKTFNKTLIIGFVLGIALTAMGYEFLFTTSDNMMNESVSDNEPLYWVAPMDPNFRREQPGKSPMGMDLVPVYDNQNAGEGIVKIAPQVVNNLGVRTVRARYGELNQEIKTVGYVQYNENDVVHIHPRVEGWVDRLYVKANGERVTKGTPLYALYSPELVNAQEEFLVAQRSNNQRLLNAAKSRLEALQMPPSNIKKLMEQGVVEQTITFKAPQSGVVERLNIREGFFVEPSTTMMSVADLSTVWVDVDVFERQSLLLREGQKVDMSHASVPARVWRGKVDYVYPTIDPKTRTQRARVKFHNKDGTLKPGMFTDISLYIGMADNTLMIPKNAIIRAAGQNRVVLALGGGRFKSIPVQLGYIGHEMAQVVSGIETGQSVVTHAQFLIDSESNRDTGMTRLSEWSPDMLPNSVESATVEGRINRVNLNKNSVNISRESIPKWNRPASTLDFILDAGVRHRDLLPGNLIEFTFEIHNGEFLIVSYEVLETNGDSGQ